MAEVLQIGLAQSALEKRPCIYPRRGVTLEVHKVARQLTRASRARILGMEEVVEPDLQERCQRRIRRDVPADARILLILTMHHRHRVPANQRLDSALERTVARVGNLVM